jgi:hypothetical protein
MLNVEPTAYWSKSLNKNNTGLGNVLYQISTIYTICKKYNIQFNAYYINKYIKKLKDFGLNHDKKIFRNLNLSIQEEKIDIELRATDSHIYSEKLIQDIIKNKDKNILIRGSYLQSTKYYIEYEKEIQKLFEPDEEFKNLIKKKYPKIVDDTQSNICIQMRLNWGGGIKLNPQFILKSIEYLKNNNFINNNINLWIFSDNMPKAKNILSSIKNYNIIFVNDNQYDYEDLWMMSLINNHIVSFSTFSWWGAFLNQNENKRIIYSYDFCDYFCKKVLNKKYSPESIQENIYPKKWICLREKYVVK